MLENNYFVPSLNAFIEGDLTCQKDLPLSSTLRTHPDQIEDLSKRSLKMSKRSLKKCLRITILFQVLSLLISKPLLLRG
jgi:hypothetical protein